MTEIDDIISLFYENPDVYYVSDEGFEKSYLHMYDKYQLKIWFKTVGEAHRAARLMRRRGHFSSVYSNAKHPLAYKEPFYSYHAIADDYSKYNTTFKRTSGYNFRKYHGGYIRLTVLVYVSPMPTVTGETLITC